MIWYELDMIVCHVLSWPVGGTLSWPTPTRLALLVGTVQKPVRTSCAVSLICRDMDLVHSSSSQTSVILFGAPVCCPLSFPPSPSLSPFLSHHWCLLSQHLNLNFSGLSLSLSLSSSLWLWQHLSPSRFMFCPSLSVYLSALLVFALPLSLTTHVLPISTHLPAVITSHHMPLILVSMWT